MTAGRAKYPLSRHFELPAITDLEKAQLIEMNQVVEGTEPLKTATADLTRNLLLTSSQRAKPTISPPTIIGSFFNMLRPPTDIQSRAKDRYKIKPNSALRRRNYPYREESLPYWGRHQ
ncbi:hypothetical protein [Alteromonas macleodii]|uniref:hypothetical protein n=1 Tax=Alteromonas macleodii TaxID=28108 RepID=UPI0024A8351D|nr:hypothetical protein [Alteromonas macleodii]